jgi:LysM repeat protein
MAPDIKLQRLTIHGYETEDLTGTGFATFVAPINPASISLSHAISFKTNDAANTNNPQVLYYSGAPPKLNFELIIDGTGMVSDMRSAAITKEIDPVNVLKKIEEFKKACYYYVGEEHQPPYVKILWGETLLKYKKNDFAGRLENFSLNYTLFNKDGSPLRAKISASFMGSFKPEVDAKSKDAKSPDLTHLITVKAGDALPSMCKNIYGDAQLYHQVAKINKISNFRKLEPGQVIEFPPIK